MFRLRGRQDSFFRRAVALVVISVFFFTSILNSSYGFSQEPPRAFRNVDISPQRLRPLSSDTFDVPSYMAEVKDRYKGESNFIVIHIQDAHCNYDAQKRISEIVAYLNREYGVKVANLEGGKDRYDLKIFTDIYDDEVRGKVSDYFVKQGMVNGAEDFAINNPGEILLWGVEDERLYLENLKIYRDSLLYKDEVDRIIKTLQHILNNLKRNIYPDELLGFDMKYSSFKFGNLEFREYFTYLISKAKEHAIDIKKFPNLFMLYKSMHEESGIDFKRANKERDILVERLTETISKNALGEFAQKSLNFKEKLLPAIDYYNYLIGQANFVGIDLEEYPELQKYVVYIALYDAIDKSKIMNEVTVLEDQIKEDLYQNDKQRNLSKLAKNLIVTKNLFDLDLIKQDYEYYRENKRDFDVDNFTSFINKEAPLYKISAEVDDNTKDLDDYRERMENFFEYSFQRDDAFLENLRFGPTSRIGTYSSILVTGGFHTDNILELLKSENISYVSLLPKFINESGYESPYFKLLAGKETGMMHTLHQILPPVSYMQIASMLSGLGEEVWSTSNIRDFRAAVYIQRMISQGKSIKLALEDGREIVFGEGEDVQPITVSKLIYDTHEELIDKVLREAYENRNNNVTSVSEDSRNQAAERIEELAGEITDSTKAEMLLNLAQNIRDNAFEINLVDVGDADFRGHAGGMGININSKYQDQAVDIIVHEAIAGIVGDNRISEAAEANDIALATNLIEDADFYNDFLWNMSQDQRMRIARDYLSESDFLGLRGEFGTDVTGGIFFREALSTIRDLDKDDIQYYQGLNENIIKAQQDYEEELEKAIAKDEQEAYDILATIVDTHAALLEKGIFQVDLKPDNIVEPGDPTQKPYTFDYDYLFLANKVPHLYVRYFIYASMVQTANILRRVLANVYNIDLKDMTATHPVFIRYFNKYLSMLADAGIATELIEKKEIVYDEDNNIVYDDDGKPKKVSAVIKFIDHCWDNDLGTRQIIGSYRPQTAAIHRQLIAGVFNPFIKEFMAALQKFPPTGDRNKAVDRLYLHLRDKGLLSNRIARDAINWLYEVIDEFHYDYNSDASWAGAIRELLIEKLTRLSVIGIENIRKAEQLDQEIGSRYISEKQPVVLSSDEAKLFEEIKPMFSRLKIGKIGEGGFNIILRKKEFDKQIKEIKAALISLRQDITKPDTIAPAVFETALKKAGLFGSNYLWTAKALGMKQEEYKNATPKEKIDRRNKKIREITIEVMPILTRYLNNEPRIVSLVNTLLNDGFVFRMSLGGGTVNEFRGFDDFSGIIFSANRKTQLSREEIDNISEKFRGELIDVNFESDYSIEGKVYKRVMHMRFSNGLEITIPDGQKGLGTTVNVIDMAKRQMDLVNSIANLEDLDEIKATNYLMGTIVEPREIGSPKSRNIYLGSFQEDFNLEGHKVALDAFTEEAGKSVKKIKQSKKSLEQDLMQEIQNIQEFQDALIGRQEGRSELIAIEEVESILSQNKIKLKAWVYGNTVLLRPMYSVTTKVLDAQTGTFVDEVKWSPIGGLVILNEAQLYDEDGLTGRVGEIQDKLDDYAQADAGFLLKNIVDKAKMIIQERKEFLASQPMDIEIIPAEEEPSPVENVEARRDHLIESLRGVYGRQNTVISVIGVRADVFQENSKAFSEVIGNISKQLRKKGIGRFTDARQVVLFPIYPDSKKKTEKSFVDAMDRASKLDISEQGKIVGYVPELGDWNIAEDLTGEYQDPEKFVIFEKDMCEEVASNGLTGIIERHTLARYAAFSRNLELYSDNLENKRTALKMLTDFLGRITDEDLSNITNLSQILTRALTLKAMDFSEIQDWADMQEDVAISL